MTAGTVAANLGGVALFALPGLAAAELVPPLARLALRRRLGYAYLLGVAAVAGLLFAASHLLAVPLRRPAIAAGVLLPVAAGLAARLARHRRQAAAHRRQVIVRRRISPWDAAAALLAGLVGLGILATALSVPLADWDGRMIWSALAEHMRHEGTVTPSVLTEPHWFVMHPRYPPLLPVAQAAIQETFAAAPDEQLYRAFYVAFLAALLLVLRDGAGRAAGTAAAALAVLAAALPHFLGYGSGGAVSAYSDLPLAAFYGAALVLLLLAPRRPALGLAAGCLLAAAVLTKNEGAPLAGAALLLAAGRVFGPLRLPGSGSLRTALRRPFAWFAAAALPPIGAAALLASWRAAIPNRFDEDYLAVLHVPTLLHQAVALLPTIGQEIARLTFRTSDWQGLWIAWLAVLLAALRVLRRPTARLLLLAGLAPAALAWAAYAETTPLSNLAPFISETWPRFLVQGLLPLSILLALALRQLLARARTLPGRHASPSAPP